MTSIANGAGSRSLPALSLPKIRRKLLPNVSFRLLPE
jgi:hypothetical protein